MCQQVLNEALTKRYSAVIEMGFYSDKISFGTSTKVAAFKFGRL